MLFSRQKHFLLWQPGKEFTSELCCVKLYQNMLQNYRNNNSVNDTIQLSLLPRLSLKTDSAATFLGPIVWNGEQWEWYSFQKELDVTTPPSLPKDVYVLNHFVSYIHPYSYSKLWTSLYAIVFGLEFLLKIIHDTYCSRPAGGGL